MKIFIISDTHFNHENIIKYSNRPFKSPEEMDKELIRRWNNKVGKEDIVIHLGDFALGSEKEIKELKDTLNGTIFLLRGNHDHKIIRKARFIIIDGNLEIDHLIFSHNPLKKEDIPKGFINVHGHIHEKESQHGFNASVEKMNYEPIELEELKKRIQKLY